MSKTKENSTKTNEGSAETEEKLSYYNIKMHRISLCLGLFF